MPISAGARTPLVAALLSPLVLLVFSPASADSPPAQAAPAASSPAASTATASAPATSAVSASAASVGSSAAPHVAASTQELTPDEKRLISAGYHMQVVDGQKQFCRREHVMGTNIEHKVCGTAEQMAQATQQGRELTDRTQRVGINPTGK
jgi:hypothetical protein